ncbi:hypothetical protein ULT26_004316 [Salmonella enterica]|nr:hypothetical protein [Salmonella enterica]
MTEKQYPSEQYLKELLSNTEFASAAPVEVVRCMAKELLKLRGRKVPEAIDGSKIAYVYLDETTTDKLDAYVKGFNACRDKMLR